VTQRRSWLWRYRRLLFMVWLIGFAALAGAAYVLSRVPLPADRPQAQTTFLYDANDVRLGSLSAEDRTPVKLTDVPPVLVDAVVATEDRGFFKHGGVDPVGLVRATIADLRHGGTVQGGSTITQQYVKNVYVGTRRNLARKLREAVLSVKVERKYSKKEILERYLNTIYFGRGAYGVQAASRAYFGKDVGQIDLPEAALLAGLIRSPESAEPDRAPQVATARRASSLNAMVKVHRISARQRSDAAASALGVVPRQQQDASVAMADKGTRYFFEYVRALLVQRYGERAVASGGLRVKTTLDLGMQAKAYDAVYGYLKPTEPAGALVAVDDQGAVKAMVGGRDFSESSVNLAVGREGGGAGRQAGSTFKPFLLAETVKEGYSVLSSFPGPPQVVIPKADNGKDWPVTNFDNEDAGPSINLVDATAHSVNTVYAQLETAIGAPRLVDMAHQLGITSPLPANASLVLGTSDVSVLEMAGAYSTFANRGMRIDPYVISEVRTADGTVLDRARPVRVKVLERNQVDVVNYCLQQVVQKGTGTGAQFGHPLAGKTGTTEDFADAWFVGYTPKLTAAVWMGYPEGTTRKMTNVRGRKVNGGSFPATIFQRFMAAVSQGVDTGSFSNNAINLNGRTVRAVNVKLPTTTTSSTSSTTVPAGATTTTAAVKPTSTTVPAPTSTTRPQSTSTTVKQPPPPP
jgi:penicillin-binding protein 1A